MLYPISCADTGAMELFGLTWPPNYMKRTFAIAFEDPHLGAKPMHALSPIAPSKVQAPF